MHIALFMTLNVGINTWVKTGLFDREISYYKKLLEFPSIENIYIFTYDTHLDQRILAEIPQNIRIILMPRAFSFGGWFFALLYSFLLPMFHWKILRQVAVMKSNQTLGAWTAWLSARLTSAKFIYRSGYLTSSLLQNNLGTNKSKFKAVVYTVLETMLARLSDCIIVSSKHNYHLMKARIRSDKYLFLINNPIDTDFFKSDNTVRRRLSFLYVGRLSAEKNISNLIKSILKTGNVIKVIGRGTLKESLLQQFSDSKDVSFLEFATPLLVKQELQNHEYFCNTSYHEGMPKSLLEAMSMECVCVCTPTDAALEVIIDGYNGFVANDFSEDGIAQAILRAVSYSSSEIKLRARETVMNKFDLKLAVKQELEIYETL